MTERVRELLEAAFDAARRTGKKDWRRMTTAVLKNRLLQMTGRQFDEKQHGASTMLELVTRFPDLIRVERSTSPAVLIWLVGMNEVVDEVTPPQPAAVRIRADLWKAVLDYSSGYEYEWDPQQAQARRVERAEESRRLPTVDRESLSQWRREFEVSQASQVAADAQAAEQVRRWREAGLGTQYLPGPLQAAWNEFMKQKVMSLLAQWFQEKGYIAPRILSEASPPVPSRQAGAQERLREFIIQCVRVMTEEELRELRLPAEVFLRMQRGR